jgi:hypothetical protein
VPFSSCQGFTKLEGKDKNNKDMVSTAVQYFAKLVFQYYPLKYKDKQLISANSYKSMMRDAGRKTPRMMTMEEAVRITNNALRVATTHPSIFSTLWDEENQWMSNTNNAANYWCVAISEHGSLYYQKQWEIEHHTPENRQKGQGQGPRTNVPMIRYEVPIETVMEERAWAESYAENRRQQGISTLEMILAPWHNTKDTSIWGRGRYAVDLVHQTIDVLFSADPTGILHPLPDDKTHQTIKKKEAIPAKLMGSWINIFRDSQRWRTGNDYALNLTSNLKRL